MENVIKVSKPKAAIIGFLPVFITVLLFSCNKNVAEIPKQSTDELSVANISSHASSRTSTVAVPFEDILNIPCANNGDGENVLVTGLTNFVYQLAWNEQGFHLSYQYNDHNVTGVGLTTGDSFVGSGGAHDVATGSWVNNQFISTLVMQTKLVSKNTSFTVRRTVHLVILPDGTVTLNKREQTADCN